MSQDSNIVLLEHKKRSKAHKLTDRDRVIFGYHYLEENNIRAAVDTLGSVTPVYWTEQFHKDISRALLCQATYPKTMHPGHGKESEFYLVVYRLTKYIVTNKIHFSGSGNIYLLKDQLFKDLM